MQKKYFILIMVIAGLLFASCTKDNVSENPVQVVIAFAPENYTDAAVFGNSRAATTRTTATAEEMKLTNAYIILFDNAGANPLKYYIEPGTNETDFQWIWGANTPTTQWARLKFYPKNNSGVYMTAAELGTRKIYLFANVNNALKTTLDGIATETALISNHVVYTGEPWSITTPLLMEGFATHNFENEGAVTATIPLRRAVAKLEIDITLAGSYQSTVTNDYKYRYLQFGNQSYLLEHALPQVLGQVVNNPANGTSWNNIPAISLITNGGGKVTGIKLITYINEYKNSTTKDIRPKVEIQLPYNDGGFLPPPEFGEEGDTYVLQLPIEVKRNHYYSYSVEVK